MRIDRALPSAAIGNVGDLARDAERSGYDGLWVSETNHDPFLGALLAARETSRLTVGTSVAIAFARSPMTTALAAWDLSACSGGRFVLGLGTQVRAHIERRYSMPWSHPVQRMREYVGALRAIWDSWQSGTKLDFRGEYYTHTLMTPLFSPSPLPPGPPGVFLAGVGSNMVRLAGEVADGLIVHPFCTQRYLHEVIVPTTASALSVSGRQRSAYQLVALPIVVTGNTEATMRASADEARRRLAFYASTPAYRPVLELHGWGDAQTELNTLARCGSWEAMGNLIDDGMLDELAIVGEPDTVVARLRERFGDTIDRLAPHAAPNGTVEDRDELSSVVGGWPASAGPGGRAR